MNSTDNAQLINVYLELFKEHNVWCRHYEAQRSSGCTLIFIFSGIVLSITEFAEAPELRHVYAGLFVVSIGIFGLFFIWKHYERYIVHFSAARQFRDLMEKETSIDFKIIIKDQYEYASRISYFCRFLRRPRLHYYWSILMISVIFVGIYIFSGTL